MVLSTIWWPVKKEKNKKKKKKTNKKTNKNLKKKRGERSFSSVETTQERMRERMREGEREQERGAKKAGLALTCLLQLLVLQVVANHQLEHVEELPVGDVVILVHVVNLKGNCKRGTT